MPFSQVSGFYILLDQGLRTSGAERSESLVAPLCDHLGAIFHSPLNNLTYGEISNGLFNFSRICQVRRCFCNFYQLSQTFVLDTAGKLGRVLACFSFRRNIKSLLSSKSHKKELKSLHGIRFFTLNWIILGHTWQYINYFAFSGYQPRFSVS